MGVISITATLVAAVVPSKWFITKSGCKENCAIEYALVPADAQPVEPRLAVDGIPTFDSKGQIFFVTIREPKITLLDWMVAHREPSARFLTYKEKFGNQTEAQLLQSGQRQMTGAKDRATYVALKAAGFDVKRKNGPAVVDYVVCVKANAAGTKCIEEAPAGKVLKPNDTITEINGTKVTTLDDVSPIISKVTAGDSVDVTLVRDTKELKVRVQTVSAPGESPTRTIIGFSPVDTTTVELPPGLKVSFDTEGIGGPSAGLAFTLTIIDQVTEGQLMGNLNVAVTGEIDIDGKVGAIGGLNSKAKAVEQMGVKYFLVPAGQPGPESDKPGKLNLDSIEAARKVVGNRVQIIPVATLDEALAVLRRLGGDPLPAK